jgi:hypothetical protein
MFLIAPATSGAIRRPNQNSRGGSDLGNGAGVGGVFVGGFVEGEVTFEGARKPAPREGLDTTLIRLLP